jgi:hypothetical protein
MMTRAKATGWGNDTTGVNRCQHPTSEDCFLPITTNDPETGNDSGGTFVEYPHLYFDRSSHLAVMAWTNAGNCNVFGYYNIQYILSPDDGANWYGKNGLIAYSSLPIKAGDTGPSFSLLAPSEYVRTAGGCASLRNWLVNIYAQDGHVFFLYRRATGDALYRRVTVTFTGSGFSVKNDIGPVNIPGVGNGNGGGSFAGEGTAGARIFLTASTVKGTGVIVKDTVNDGATWSTFATDPTPLAAGKVYALSGSHRLGPGGQILAAFTDSHGGLSDVYFVHNPH